MCAMFVHSLPPIISTNPRKKVLMTFFVNALIHARNIILGMTRSPRVYSKSETSN